MFRHFSWVLAALLLLAAPARWSASCTRPEGVVGQNRGDQKGPDQDKRQPPKWWTDEPMRGELGITDQQSAAVEQLWQKTIPKLREARERLDKLEEQLSQMSSTPPMKRQLSRKSRKSKIPGPRRTRRGRLCCIG